MINGQGKSLVLLDGLTDCSEIWAFGPKSPTSWSKTVMTYCLVGAARTLRGISDCQDVVERLEQASGRTHNIAILFSL